MACFSSPYVALLLSPRSISHVHQNRGSKRVKRIRVLPSSSIGDTGVFYNTLVSEAVRLLVPQANFEASKLKVEFLREGLKRTSGAIPRTYILSHCDFTANLTLTISNVINLDQLEGWYKKDDVVAEWKKVDDNMGLHVHCCVSGPNPLQDVAAEFRYHIFSKELPLVLKAVIYGDSMLFREHPELMGAYVWVYFHSSSPKYNRMECWGSLREAAEGNQKGEFQGFLTVNKDIPVVTKNQTRPKSILQALFAFLL